MVRNNLIIWVFYQSIFVELSLSKRLLSETYIQSLNRLFKANIKHISNGQKAQCADVGEI